MKGNFDAALKEILLHEGGFVNHPKDPGGMTNLGVTKATYEAWVGYPVSEAIMRKLTPALVKPLYKRKYWDMVQADALPIGLDLCVFDFAVNAGPSRAVRYLQKMVGASTDGVIGPKTISLVEQFVAGKNLSFAVMKYQDMRQEYYHQLNTFPTFGRGWIRRVKEVEKTALNMVKGAMKA
jgi:lysozyme family protein